MIKDKLSELKSLRIALCFTISSMGCADLGSAIIASAELEEIIGTLYENYSDFITFDEYQKALQEPEFAVILIDRTINILSREGSNNPSAV
ncbi:MAG: hypothetical protein N2317_02345 [Syntrophales bacterium]|nr:hypothetical protein [Syntrophales bacterium]